MTALYDLVCENCECGSKSTCDEEQRRICYNLMFGVDEDEQTGDL